MKCLVSECPLFPENGLQTGKKRLKVPLRSNFCIPFFLHLWKVEVIEVLAKNARFDARMTSHGVLIQATAF